MKRRLLLIVSLYRFSAYQAAAGMKPVRQRHMKVWKKWFLMRLKALKAEHMRTR